MNNRRRLSGKWEFAVALSLASGIYGANFVGNPNQMRWKFSEEMDVPHIAWAKPLAGGPVNATIIAPVFYWEAGGGCVYRDVAELCQRLSVHVNPVMTKDHTTIPDAGQYDCAYPDLGDTPDVWMALVQERLQKPADVIVIGKVLWTAFRVNVPGGGWEKGTKWSAFSVDLRASIVERVKAGCGLLYINPYLERGAGGEVSLYVPTGDLPPLEKGKEGVVPAIGEKVTLKKVDAADDLLRGLTGLKLPPLGQKEWTDLVYTGTLGKGRVLVVDYPRAGDWAGHSLTPGSPGAGDMICGYEYLMSLTARAVLWCAGRGPQAKIQKIEADPAQGIKLAIANRPADTTLTVELRDVSGEIGRVVKAWDAAEPSLTLPKLKSGAYFVNAWLKNNKGEVLDWGSARLDVAAGGPAPKLIKGIETREPALRAGQPIAGEVLLTCPWPAGDVLRLSVMDTSDRCLWRQEWKKPAERSPFSAELDPGRSVTLILRAERLRGGEAAEVCEKMMCLATMQFDGDFASVLWSGLGADERFNRQDLSLLRRLGIDTMLYVGYAREACIRANMRLGWNPDRVTGFSGQGFCKQALDRWTTLYRGAAASSKALAPLALTFGDEAQYEWRSDGSAITGGSASRDEDFRAFLGQWFDKAGGKLDLTVLNKAWGTAYKSEDEIKVRTADELRASNGRAQWVCEALWTEWQYHRLLYESQKAAQAEAPLTYYGDEGVGSMFTGDGHDYYIMGRDMTLCQLYDTGAGPFLVKSFAGPNTMRGMWTGNYSYFNGVVDEEWMRSRPWRSLFYGMNSEWWWMQSLSIRADGKPIPCFAQYCEEVRRIKAGPATLMLKVAKPFAPQVAALYSPNTIHVSTFDQKGPGPHPGALIAACEGLIRSGYAFNMLHPSQLDDSKELGSGYRALVLPAILAVSERQAESIRKFVEQGGLLIADQAPEQYFNELGVPYAKDPFRSVFAKGADATQFKYGKGKALFLKEPFSLSHLIRYKNVLGQTYSEKNGKPLARLFREWIESATGCKPPVSVTLPDGGPLVDGEISSFTDGAALYVGIDRNGRYWEGDLCRWLKWDWYQEEVEATLTFPTAAHVYDVTRSEYLGQGPTVKVKLTSYPRLFAALPAKVEMIKLAGCRKRCRTGETIRLKATVSHGRGAQWSSVVHVGLCDEKGDMLPWSERNMVAIMGEGEIALPLALDEKPGEYTLKARDVASGVEAVHKMTIAKK